MIFLILSIIFCPVSNSLECDCPARSLEQIFCESDFAIGVFVKSREIEFKTGLRYNIKLIDFYEKAFNPKKSTQILKNILVTDSIGSAHDYPECVREFKEGENYILTGKFNKVKAFTNKCEFGKESNSLNTEEKMFFSDGYKKINCSEFGITNNTMNIIPMSPYREKAGNHQKINQDDENIVEERDYDEDVGYNDEDVGYSDEDVGYSDEEDRDNEEDEESYEYDRDNNDEDDFEGIDLSEKDGVIIRDQDITDEDEVFEVGNDENYIDVSNEDLLGGQEFGDAWNLDEPASNEMEEDYGKRKKLRKRVKRILSKFFPKFMVNGSNIE
jgi:hypothetical protein